ncbi:MAG: hypothetical protein P8J69_00440 [Flavobacteriaceae bacterium]|jgi:hypothetical protein|nr:hypothetical protein [Flavobacteriaceae bacterium]|tara:strand:+ start:44 stop:292 length:249 start_codon:yes stop_codon:yes gene_type:complete
MKKNKQKLLDDFDKSMKRDKSNDIIVGNSFMKNEEFQKEMFNKIFYEKLRDFFSNYLDRMNPSEKELMETQKSKKIRVRKMF